MYHRVAVESFDPWGLAVSPANFAAQLDWLQRNRRVIALPVFVDLLRRGTLPANAVAITFDDGYACNAEVASPLLAARGLPATIFLPTELITAGREFWWDDLERIVLNCSTPRIDLRLPSGVRSVELGERQSDDRIWAPGALPATPRQSAFQKVWEMLKVLAPEAQQEAMDNLRDQAGTPQSPRRSHRPMTGDEIRQVQSAGIEIGAHSLTHTSLSSRDIAAQAAEISQSRAQCTAITGIPPSSFAYPYGDYDAHSPGLAADAGFTCACTTDANHVRRNSDPFALPRIQVEDWDGAELGRTLRIIG